MSEKLMAGVITAAIIAPICSVCILGTAALGGFLGSMAAWIGGFGPFATTGIIIATAAILVTFSKRRSRASVKAKSKSTSSAISPVRVPE